LEDEEEERTFGEGVNTLLITFPTPVCLFCCVVIVLTGAGLELELLALLTLPFEGLYAPKFTLRGVEFVTLPTPG
jgi:hypothetical protein